MAIFDGAYFDKKYGFRTSVKWAEDAALDAIKILESRFGSALDGSHPILSCLPSEKIKPALDSIRNKVVFEWAFKFERENLSVDLISEVACMFSSRGLQFPTLDEFVIAARMHQAGAFAGVLPLGIKTKD
ncbi:hypothetical protein LHK_01666 [Laribacter hongkongensis HLHK9]|uniref:Uncharacterized protein n=1 Tax=Laribacter hongkongensis (strain HLHK9) TaxID=557598 RepID=C1D861_LARHH|nr:hypothetical protein [Laribacter hongkongensis]ACO74651.1 hypothetical protein LHK_01666 [Laribacter hongkongensis HLHK9]